MKVSRLPLPRRHWNQQPRKGVNELAKERKEEDRPQTGQLSDAEARGEGDLVVLTNDSGNVKKLTPDEWETQKETLQRQGWRELGAE